MKKEYIGIVAELLVEVAKKKEKGYADSAVKAFESLITYAERERWHILAEEPEVMPKEYIKHKHAGEEWFESDPVLVQLEHCGSKWYEVTASADGEFIVVDTDYKVIAWRYIGEPD